MTRFTTFLWALIVSISLAHHVQAQVVPSSCNFDPTFEAKYAKGSWNSAYAYLNTLDSVAFSTNPEIPASLHETIMRNIAAVYNTSLAARDTVVNGLNIVQFEPIDLLRFELKFDTTFPWVNQFLSGNMTGTDNLYINQAAAQYGMVIETLTYEPAWVTTHDATARIRIAIPHNTNAIARMMLMQNGVLFANSAIPMGDGNQIIYGVEGDHKIITFRYGWQTCPAGCEYQRDWRFRVFNDCSVEYVGSYGDLLLGASDLVAEGNLTAYPNPATNGISVSMTNTQASGIYQLTLTDITGRTVLQQTAQVTANQTLSLPLHHVANGTYVLRLYNNTHTGALKVTVLR